MKSKFKTHRNKQPLGIIAYNEIYRRIMTLEYEPGLRLEEKDLVAQLGIGRTPVREALFRLAADFMVESQPNKGFVVRPITIQNTKAAFAALKIMELGVADLAVKQDPRSILNDMEEDNAKLKDAVEQGDVLSLVESNGFFHQHFAECSRNEYLIHGLHKVRCETNRLAYLSFGNEIDPLKSRQDHYNSVIQEHEQIIRRIARQDDVALKEAVMKHIQSFQNRILLYMAS